MRRRSLALYAAPWPGEPSRTFTDFHVGRFHLAKHLGTDLVAIPDVRPDYVAQLLLEQPHELPGDRVPLYVCPLCGDSACGVISVKVHLGDEVARWSDFGFETGGGFEEGYGQNEILSRTGPFELDLGEYRSLLRPYSRRRK